MDEVYNDERCHISNQMSLPKVFEMNCVIQVAQLVVIWKFKTDDLVSTPTWTNFHSIGKNIIHMNM